MAPNLTETFLAFTASTSTGAWGHLKVNCVVDLFVVHKQWLSVWFASCLLSGFFNRTVRKDTVHMPPSLTDNETLWKHACSSLLSMFRSPQPFTLNCMELALCVVCCVCHSQLRRDIDRLSYPSQWDGCPDRSCASPWLQQGSCQILPPAGT